MSWKDDYPTALYRGPDQYPVPDEWVLNVVEMDGVTWYRYHDADNGHEAKHESDIRPIEVRDEGPDDVAMLLAETDEYWNVSHELMINGETLFIETGIHEDELWQKVAEELSDA